MVLLYCDVEFPR